MTQSDHQNESSPGSCDVGESAVVWTLGELARRFDLELVAGSNDTVVRGVCSLEHGSAERLAYADGKAHLAALQTTDAGAVIVPAELAEQAPRAALVAATPQLSFARIAALFDYCPVANGIHPTAIVHPDAHIGEGVDIGPNVVIGAESVIGASTRIGANTVIGDQVIIGESGRIGTNVSMGHRVRIGARVQIEPNAVIGARGFGLVHNGSGWESIPQLGSVVLGDDVEVGASTTIDRGALDDTVICDDVRIDNQVQIGHNCKIGAHTVIAGDTGIAGSCNIGANCMLGGAIAVNDHVNIVDNVMITGASQVAHDIDDAGVWSSTFRAMPAGQWRRLLARFRKLGHLDQRLKRLENRFDSREQQD